MKTLPGFFSLDRSGISPEDVTQMVFHCDPQAIHADVILLPYWQPDVFARWAAQITTITKNILFEMEYRGKAISVVRSGVGAPLAGDAALALGCTDCKRLIFAGSVGSLRPEIQIGDLMMPEFTYSGDGFCRYLDVDGPRKDCFLEQNRPDEALSAALLRKASLISAETGVAVHTGPVYCIDSILSQFRLLDYLAGDLGCIGVEMETAAVFKAAHMAGIRAAALFSVSDIPVLQKTLYAGRTPEEQARRKEIRSRVLAKAVLDCLLAFPPEPAKEK